MTDIAALLTEQPNPAAARIDKLSTLDMLRVINGEDRKVAAAVEAELTNIARAVDGIVEAFQRGGRLFYIGAGTSGRLGVLDGFGGQRGDGRQIKRPPLPTSRYRHACRNGQSRYNRAHPENDSHDRP